MNKTKTCFAALAGLLAASTASAQFTDILYSNDFSGAASGGFSNSSADFATSGAGSWSTASGSYDWSGSNNASTPSFAAASTQLSTLGGTNDLRDFQITAQVTLASLATTTTTTNRQLAGSISFLSTSPSFAFNSGYEAGIVFMENRGSYSYEGRLYIEKDGYQMNSDVSQLASQFFFGGATPAAGNVPAGTTLFFTITGTYDLAGQLSIAFTATDGGSNSRTLNAIDAAPHDGTYFGFNQGIRNNNATIQWDNLLVAAAPVPEPSAFAALAGLAAVGFAATRRRRRA